MSTDLTQYNEKENKIVLLVSINGALNQGFGGWPSTSGRPAMDAPSLCLCICPLYLLTGTNKLTRPR